MKLRRLFISNLCIFLTLSILICPSVSYAAENSTSNHSITYITGTTPLKEAVAISQKGWSQSDSVCLASGTDFPDALAGSSFAIVKDSPILYTASAASLDFNGDNTNWNEIVRLNAKRAYILGGTGVVSKNIEESLKSKGIEVIRVSGDDRYKTAKAIGDELMKINKTDTVFLAYAGDFPDAAAVSTFAGQMGCPILLTDKNSLNPATLDALKEWGIRKAYIAGGTGVISQKVEDTVGNQDIWTIRLGGMDRYETAQKIIMNFKKDFKALTLTTGTDFHGALAGSVYGYKTGHPVMLFDKNMSQGIKGFAWTCTDLVCIGNNLSQSDIQPDKPVGFVNTAGAGNPNSAGVFNTPDDKLVTVDRSKSFEYNFPRLNSMIFDTYWIWYGGFYSLTEGSTEFVSTFKYDGKNNRYGVEIFGWRQSLVTSAHQNKPLNAALETFYFLCGDKEVAYALWSWIDAANINDYADSNDYGFTDVTWAGYSGVMKMNNTEIEVSYDNGVTTLYFNKP